MAQRGFQQLDKVLALADSHHEGEALVAVRMARQILSRDGLSFGELARAASRPRFGFPLTRISEQKPAAAPAAAADLAALRQQLLALQQDNETLHRRALAAEASLRRAEADALRWKKLAQETVEKLWDAGQPSGNG